MLFIWAFTICQITHIGATSIEKAKAHYNEIQKLFFHDFERNVDLNRNYFRRRGEFFMVYQSKKGVKAQESIQSSTTPDPGYHMGK